MTAAPTPRIQFKKITKVFGENFACRDISFSIEAGSIHAVVGENGAGKSTLMKLLGGLVPLTSGQMFLSGAPYHPLSAQSAFEKKISFIHQHFVLADHLTALDNLILSSCSVGSVLRTKPSNEIRHRADLLLKKFSWTMNLDQLVQNLSIGNQQRLEILKALLQHPEIFIFDEPTAVLTPQESSELLDFILALKNDGKTIILISHKLHEVKKIADAISILRHGQLIFSGDAQTISEAEIAEKMIGRRLDAAFDQNKAVAGDDFLNLTQRQFTIKKSEIFGVAGVEGNGQDQLIAEILEQFQTQKLCYGDISEDRLRLSVFANLSLTEHMLLKHSSEFTKNGWIKSEALDTATAQLVKEWDVRPGQIAQPLSELSGGNQQKFIVGRELWNQPDILLAAHPTRGVDLGAQQKIHQALLAYKKSASIVLISSDLDEIIALADRFIVLYKSKAYGPFKRNQLSEIEIGLYMAGS